MTADDTTLSRLMALAQQGDKQAYRTALSETQRWLTRYFNGRIAPSSVDDLVQETLLSVHRKRASYDPERPYLPWLAAIARYRWVDLLRRTYRANETELEDVYTCAASDEDVISKISIDRLLSFLPSGQADAIRLVKIEGLSIVEAAERSGQSAPLVKVNIHRGLKKLATLVESE